MTRQVEQETFYPINMNFRFCGDKSHFCPETGAKKEFAKIKL